MFKRIIKNVIYYYFIFFMTKSKFVDVYILYVSIIQPYIIIAIFCHQKHQ